MQSPIIIAEFSENRKLSKRKCISTTYASQSTCPKTCPLRHHGCYAELAHTGLITHRINQSEIIDPVEIAKIEAKGIKQLVGITNIRLHTVGDCPNSESAQIVSKACDEYIKKYNKQVWGYTHARIPRSDWGKVSMLRSCQTLRQAEGAMQANYAAALVVSHFKGIKRYYIGRGMYGIPCPAQVNKDIACDTCKLCMKDQMLLKNKSVILFKAHGMCKKSIINNILK
jgi:hypothetical protein